MRNEDNWSVSITAGRDNNQNNSAVGAFNTVNNFSSTSDIDLVELARELRKLQGKLYLLEEENGSEYMLARREVSKVHDAVDKGEQPDDLKTLSGTSKNIVLKIATDLGLPILLNLMKIHFSPDSE